VDEDEENNATVDRMSKRHGTAYVTDDQSERSDARYDRMMEKIDALKRDDYKVRLRRFIENHGLASVRQG
jgi:NAD-dependent DNA ligase